MDYILARIGEPFLAPLDPSHRIYSLYLCTALAFAIALFIFGGGRRGGLSLREFCRFCLPKSVYLHASARVDKASAERGRALLDLKVEPALRQIVAVRSQAASNSTERPTRSPLRALSL